MPPVLSTPAFTKCTRCALSEGRKHDPIPGNSPCPLKDVRLIVISAYPGAEEVRAGQALSPSTSKVINAGKIFQTTISTVSKELGFDLYAVTYRTNAMKCPPRGRKGNQLVGPRDTCKGWLLAELSGIPSSTPILLAGSDAVHSLLGTSLFDSRGIIHYYNNHPVVTTVNPIEVERSARFTRTSDGLVVGAPPLIGSTGWLYKRDLNLLKTLIQSTKDRGEPQ